MKMKLVSTLFYDNAINNSMFLLEKSQMIWMRILKRKEKPNIRSARRPEKRK